MKVPGLPSEICGIIKGKSVPPKSFGSFLDDKRKLVLAYSGLSYLIGDFYDKKNISFEFNSSVDVLDVESPLVLQVLFGISAIRDHLRRSPCAKFERQTIISSSIKGRVDFLKTLTRFHGLLHKTAKEVNIITEQTLERRFLSLALPIIQSKVAGIVSNESKKNLVSIFDECKFHLSSVTVSNGDIYQMSTSIIRKRGGITLDEQILPFCKLLAHFLLNDFFLNSESSQNRNCSSFDFLLNLNRPFESMLKQLIQKKIPQKAKEKDVSGFANLYYAETDKVAFSMRPDIWSVDNDGMLYVLDAKHKIFDSDFDEEAGSGGMKREDLYQLISYIRTNRIEQDSGVFGLIGLVDEKVEGETSINGNYFENLQPVYFDLLDKNKLKKRVEIKLVKARFGSILVKFGSLLGESKALEKFWNDLADELQAVIAIENIVESKKAA